jgi:CheY-like chemotaxis protein
VSDILLIEDDDDVRLAITEFLSEEHVVHGVSNGEEALAYLETANEPDVILLDLMMPVMDGWEFRKRQRESQRFAHIPVIAISAHGARARGQRACDADVYIGKPFRVSALLKAIADVLARPNARTKSSGPHVS